MPESYVRGVEHAKELVAARQARIASNYNAFLDAIAARDAEAAKVAKERSEARKAKYSEKSSHIVKFTPVAKGSKPIRVNDTVWDRAMYRHLKRLQAKGVDGYVEQLLAVKREEVVES
jgi:hypothetical protein